MKCNSITAIVAGLVVASTSAFAGEDSVLTIEGQEFITQAAAPAHMENCLLYTSPSPRDLSTSRMPSSA